MATADSVQRLDQVTADAFADVLKSSHLLLIYPVGVPVSICDL